jgi:uncharacterized membrane protein YgcG
LLALTPAFADDIKRIVPTSYVTDLAGVIPTGTRQRLEALCGELEQKTGAQLAIVTVRSLDDRPVEDYTVDLFKHLGVGSKKQDSGVLLLLAPNDRKYRVEVGYGLEPIINDARAGDAGRSVGNVFGQLPGGDFYGGGEIILTKERNHGAACVAGASIIDDRFETVTDFDAVFAIVGSEQ